MSVIIETSKGDLVVDVFVDDCPKAAANFLKWVQKCRAMGRGVPQLCTRLCGAGREEQCAARHGCRGQAQLRTSTYCRLVRELTLALPPSLFPCPLHRLCKLKYYNNCLFYNVQHNFIAQSGDPTNTGKGGESVWGVLYGEQARRSRGWVGVNVCAAGRAADAASPCKRFRLQEEPWTALLA
jgi:cyclophilin family peptidyl-prolyl cis-trans isomerase